MKDSWNNAMIYIAEGRRAEIERRGDWMYIIEEGAPEQRMHIRDFVHWLVKKQDARLPNPLNANHICYGIIFANRRPHFWMGVLLAAIVSMFLVLIIGNLD